MTLAPQTENTALTKILIDDGRTCEENDVPTAPPEPNCVGAVMEADRTIDTANVRGENCCKMDAKLCGKPEQIHRTATPVTPPMRYKLTS